MTPFLDPTGVEALRTALTGYTVGAVHEILGEDAWFALARNETVPGRRRTRDGSRLATLVRLFSLQVPVERTRASVAFGPAYRHLVEGGFLVESGDEVRAAVDLHPYGDESHDWWIVCDLTPGLDGRHQPMDPQYVLGISEASSSLAQLTVRRPVDSALDLGTGCGVQALHLADHAERVVATDVNPRALAMARLTAALNGIEVDVRAGSLYEPTPERFDLIVTNPPFVVSPPDGARLVYRETGFEGDDVVRRVIAGAAERLTEGGVCQVLAAWQHTDGEPWQDRLARWIEPTGLDAWVVQRERADLATYAEMWLADGGLRAAPDYVQRYDAWLDWFEGRGVEAMGFGWITLRRADRERPALRIEEYTAPVSQPVAPAMAAWLASADLLDDDLLDRAWCLADDVVQQTFGPVGAEDPSVIVVRQEVALRRSRQVDTVTAGLLGAADGQLTARQILDALASLLHADRDQLRDQYRPVIAELVDEGFLRG